MVIEDLFALVVVELEDVSKAFFIVVQTRRCYDVEVFVLKLWVEDVVPRMWNVVV